MHYFFQRLTEYCNQSTVASFELSNVDWLIGKVNPYMEIKVPVMQSLFTERFAQCLNAKQMHLFGCFTNQWYNCTLQKKVIPLSTKQMPLKGYYSSCDKNHIYM